MLASCDNCAHYRTGSCELARAPRTGDVLCDNYSMSNAFREKVLDALRRDIEREVNAVLLRFRVEQVEAFAG